MDTGRETDRRQRPVLHLQASTKCLSTLLGLMTSAANSLNLACIYKICHKKERWKGQNRGVIRVGFDISAIEICKCPRSNTSRDKRPSAS